MKQIELSSSDGKSSVRLINEDCVRILGALPTVKYDLIYCDPPFLTNTTLKSQSRIENVKGRVSFEDKFKSDDDFGSFLRDRFQVLKNRLTPGGVLCVHLDYRGTWLAYKALEELLGAENYVGEIIWQYGLGGGKVDSGYSKKHDTILIWSKNIDEVQLDQSIIEQHGSVWEIQSINPMSKERVGYPTQKPIVLLERLLDLFPATKSVLDPFMGSGTTLVAAARKGIKNIVGMDISSTALSFASRRLSEEFRKRPTIRTGNAKEVEL